MKFTQTEAAKKINGILTRGGKDLQMSERSINENLDSLMKVLVTDETELDDFIAKVKPMFETWNANAKKDYSDFVNKWKDEHPVTEPSTETAPQDKSGNDSELASLKAEIEALKQANAQSLKEAKISQKRKEVIAKLKEKGVKDDEWMDDFLSEVNITEDLDVDKKAESWLRIYNKSVAIGGGSVPPIAPTSGGSNDNNSLSDVSALAKQRREAQKVNI